MEKCCTIENSYSKEVSLEHRKKFAQFFTPRPVAELMVKWLLGNRNLESVLEPAFGLGIFSRILLTKKKELQIKGFEIDELILGKAKEEFSAFDNVALRLEDYMYNDWEHRYDGIICNPPYSKPAVMALPRNTCCLAFVGQRMFKAFFLRKWILND